MNIETELEEQFGKQFVIEMAREIINQKNNNAPINENFFEEAVKSGFPNAVDIAILYTMIDFRESHA